LISAPSRIYEDLSAGRHHLLLDFGLRLSANFHLYHQLPFTIFAQVFQPFNELKAENLYPAVDGVYGGDYPQTTGNDAVDRQHYIDQVKDPRFFVGFNLGTF
jgi:hypothetical protein